MIREYHSETIDGLCAKIIEQRDRIEALETALREFVEGYDWTVANTSNVVMPAIFHALIPKARAALTPEQDNK